MTRTDINKSAVYFSRFDLNPWGDGGQRRALQVFRALADYGIQHVPLARKSMASTLMDYLFARLLGKWNAHTWQLLRRQFLTGGEYLKWSPRRRLFVCLLRSAALDTARTLRADEWQDRLALVDDPIFVCPLVRRLKRYGAGIVAVCHNIESLNRWQVTGRGQAAIFRKEIEALSLCDLVVTISHEETAMLTGFGIAAAYLSYYPPSEAVSRLLRVRRQRCSSVKSSLLLFGSSGNASTLRGMETVLHAWTEGLDGHFPGLELRVAGFGTECLRETFSTLDNRVAFLGSLCQEALEDEMVRARACICHQEEGSGSLTRIMDMLVAGVPVLANRHAARTYHHLQGVIEYERLDPRGDASKFAPSAAEFPVPKQPDISGLLARVSG